MLRVTEYASATDTGLARRANEDALLARAPLFVVADGMGGAQAGEVASNAAVRAFEPGLPDAVSPEAGLAAVVTEANREIHAMSREDVHRAGMGTTVTAAHVGEHDVAIAHVGDSRAYRLRDGTFERLTDDHSLVEELRRQGKLTAEEAEVHPQRSIITRALGPEPTIEVDTSSWRARDGDLFLLCSDGLTSMVSEAELNDLVLRDTPTTLEALARRLIAAANAAGGKDNITVVLFRIGEVPAATAGAAPPPADEQATMAGGDAPTAAQVRAAVQDAQAAEVQHAQDAAPRRLAPREPGDPRADIPRRSTLRKLLTVITVLAVVGTPVLVAGYISSQAVYFVGTNDGFVAMYRGLPYELPAGVNLYTVNYTSGVPVAAVPAGRREALLDHSLRSREDAADLVRQLERGELVSPR